MTKFNEQEELAMRIKHLEVEIREKHTMLDEYNRRLRAIVDVTKFMNNNKSLASNVLIHSRQELPQGMSAGQAKRL